MSCTLCQSILLRHWYPREEDLPWLRCKPRPRLDCQCPSLPLFSHSHAKDIATLQQSAAKGCQFCRMLAANFSMGQGETSSRDSTLPDPTAEIRLTLVPKGPGLQHKACYERSIILGPISQYLLLATCGNHLSDGLELKQIARKDLILEWGKTRTAASPILDASISGGSRRVFPDSVLLEETNSHTGSNPSMDLLRNWLDSCEDGHEECSIGQEPLLPSRIIDVGSTSNPREPFLHVSLGHRAHYVALSHCWGQKLPIMTTTETLQAHQAGIPLSTLPRTFAEAILVVRYMGLRYLWIDSLCIIQDSPFDWEAESSKMCDYYQNAFFTIAATASANSSEGLFRRREPTQLHPCEIELRAHDEESGGHGKFRVVLTQEYPFGDEASLLDQRAWAFQESILSRRLVGFGTRQLTLECKRTRFREAYPAGNPLPDPYLWNRLRGLSIEDVHNPYRLWRFMVKVYWGRELTFPRDRLPAVSGLARHFQRSMDLVPDDYLAGLWKGDLWMDLCWGVRYPGRRPEGHDSPSWSWVSVEHQVAPSDTTGPYNELIDGYTVDYELASPRYKPVPYLGLAMLRAGVVLTGLSPFGEVSSGGIRLRCQTKPVRVRCLDLMAAGRANQGRGQADLLGYERYMDEEDSYSRGARLGGQTYEGMDRLLRFRPDISSGWVEGAWVDAILVPLSVRLPDSRGIRWWPTDAVRGIVLVSAGDEDQSVYRRCGSFFASTWSVFGASSWKGTGETATWEPVADTELCEITII